jgi:hypothetical protein
MEVLAAVAALAGAIIGAGINQLGQRGQIRSAEKQAAANRRATRDERLLEHRLETYSAFLVAARELLDAINQTYAGVPLTEFGTVAAQQDYADDRWHALLSHQVRLRLLAAPPRIIEATTEVYIALAENAASGLGNVSEVMPARA